MAEQPSRRAMLKAAAVVAALGAGGIGGGTKLFAQDESSGARPEGRTSAEATDSGLVIYYRQPATKWVEAIPLGNGRIGAMVHGGADEERVELNDNTLYSGEPGMRDLPQLDVTKDFDKVVQMLRD